MNTKQANSLPIQDILARLGMTPTHQTTTEIWYKSPFTPNQKTGSFKVNVPRNKCIDFSTTAKEMTLVDFLLAYYNSNSIKDVLINLENLSPNLPYNQSNLPNPSKDVETQKIVVLKAKEIENKALINYILSRGLDLDIVRYYCKEVYLTINGKNVFAFGLQNLAQGWVLRNKYQKITTKQDITVIRNGFFDVVVFEGFIDYLTFVSNSKSINYDYIILNSVSNINRLYPYLLDYKACYAYLDYDKDSLVGQKTYDMLFEVCKSELIDCKDISLQYRPCKDLNEYFCKERTIPMPI